MKTKHTIITSILTFFMVLSLSITGACQYDLTSFALKNNALQFKALSFSHHFVFIEENIEIGDEIFKKDFVCSSRIFILQPDGNTFSTIFNILLFQKDLIQPSLSQRAPPV